LSEIYIYIYTSFYEEFSQILSLNSRHIKTQATYCIPVRSKRNKPALYNSQLT